VPSASPHHRLYFNCVRQARRGSQGFILLGCCFALLFAEGRGCLREGAAVGHSSSGTAAPCHWITSIVVLPCCRTEAPCSQITACKHCSPRVRPWGKALFAGGEVSKQYLLSCHVRAGFRDAGALPSVLGRSPPGCACRMRGCSPLLLVSACSLLGFPRDGAPGGFHPSLVTSCCCLMFRTSFLSRNSPNKYVTVKVTHGSRRHSSTF